MAILKKTDLIFYSLIFILAVLIRIFYFIQNSNIIVASDTYGYYDVGQKLFKKQLTIDHSRPHIYPLFLALPAFLNGRIDTPVFSQPFIEDMRKVIFAQMAISVFSLLILYSLLRRVHIPPFFSFLFVSFITLNINHFASDATLMTESLTASAIIFIVYIAVSILMKFRVLNLTSLLLLQLSLFLLKPVYILLPLIPAAILIIHYKKKKILMHILVFLTIYLLSILFYIRLNSLYNGYNGISRISDYNLLGIILKENFDISSVRDNPLYEKFIEYKKDRRELMPFRFMEYVDPVYYNNKALLDRIHNFNTAVIKHNRPLFVYKSLLKIPGVMLEKNEGFIFAKTQTPVSVFFTGLYSVYNYLQIGTLIILPGFFYCLIAFLRNPDFKNSFWFLVSAISLYQILFSAFFSYGEFGRLVYPARTFIFLFSFYCWGKLLKIKTHQ